MKTTLLASLLAMLTLGSTNVFAAWSTNDVSILMPLPAADKIANLLGPEESGTKGVILPRTAYDLFPFLVRFETPDVIYREQLKVVSVRVDPCFQESHFSPVANPEKCRKQVRLVWQPILPAAKLSTTLDTAVHTFYEFNDVDWAAFLADWKFATESLPSLPGETTLNVHPGLARAGYDSTGWKKMKTTLLKHCGEKNLVRIAGMMLNGPLMWVFRSFDLSVGGAPEAVIIPRLSARKPVTAQAFTMDMEGLRHLDEFTAFVSPAPAADREWSDFIQNSLGFKTKTRPTLEDEMKHLVGRAVIFENPARENPGTLDCVSCHAAQTTRLWGATNAPALGFKWDWSKEFGANRFASTRDLNNASVNPFNTNRLRAFGYFEGEAQISQRVVNETANVLDLLDGK